MARFHGNIGFSKTQESEPGIFVEVITEKSYKGDRVRSRMSWENGDGLNDDLDINEKISVIADGFARENFGNFRYAILDSVRWKVKSIEYVHPRITLTLGGVYNGPIPVEPTD